MHRHAEQEIYKYTNEKTICIYGYFFFFARIRLRPDKFINLALRGTINTSVRWTGV